MALIGAQADFQKWLTSGSDWHSRRVGRQFEKALEWQRKLIAELVADSDPKMAERLNGNLVLYERGEPCCAEPAS